MAGDPSNTAELPESYYTPTPGQLRSAYAGQTNQLKKMGVDVNFSSRSQREKEERERQEQRARRWPKVSGVPSHSFHDDTLSDPRFDELRR